MRAYKTVNDSYIEPISFTVPRRAETFQADIFPPATGTKPAVSAKQWLDGKTDIPSKIDLESIYDGSAPKEIASDYKPPPAQATPPPAAKPEPKKEEPKATPPPAQAARGPPPSMNDQKASISAMANKFQDNDAEEEQDEEDETSSFEEISRPAPRSQNPAGRADPMPLHVPAKVAPGPAYNSSAPEPAKPSTPVKTPTLSTSSAPRALASGSPASTPTTGTSLDQIKELLENQTKIITAQNDKMAQLVTEVESLKKKVHSGSGSQDQSERIRQLELELEEARS